jgi:hypothetical protein
MVVSKYQWCHRLATIVVCNLFTSYLKPFHFNGAMYQGMFGVWLLASLGWDVFSSS